MAILAIARELASLGEETAQELARITGYRYLDKEYLERRLSGMSPDKREKYDEKNPGFWASLSQQRDDYLHYLKTAILEGAAEGNCIIIGRGASSILKGVQNMLAIKITAPVSVRVERIRALHGCDSRRALQIIEQSDHDRAGFHKYFFSSNWTDAREFDITINTANTDPAHAAVAIDTLRKILIDKEKETAGSAMVADLLLGQKVVTEVVYNRKTPIHFLEATVERGMVILHGVSNTQAAIDSALAIARTVPGVNAVESAVQLVHEFTVMP